MTDTPTPNVPDSLTVPAETEGPAVGVDEWVARHGERRTARGGRLGVVEQRLRSIPWWTWLTLFVCEIGRAHV